MSKFFFWGYGLFRFLRSTSMKRFLRLIVFEHSIFALPFALASFRFADRAGRLVSGPGFLASLLFVVLAAVCARSAAMAFNRFIDLPFDRLNPRTATRELVTGVVKKGEALSIFVITSAGFLLASYLLGTHCLILAPFVLLFLCFYSITKRFTSLSHVVLGAALALAPGGAWWVLRPQIEAPPLILMAAVLLWVAGFDIIYSLQDERFDREHQLHSLPAWLGGARALFVSRLLHVGAFLLLCLFGGAMHLSAGYYLGLTPIAAMFIYQHRLVSPEDLTHVNRAFFTTNGWVSVYYLVLSLVV